MHLHPFRVGARSLRDFARKWGAERTGRPAHPVHAPSRCRSSVRANVIIVTSARFANLAIRFPHTTSKTVLANRHSVAYVRSVSLGRTFVQVWLLVNKKSGARHAVKILDDRLDTEITIFQQLEHKNIVRFIRSFGPCPIAPGLAVRSSGTVARADGHTNPAEASGEPSGYHRLLGPRYISQRGWLLIGTHVRTQFLCTSRPACSTRNPHKRHRSPQNQKYLPRPIFYFRPA